MLTVAEFVWAVKPDSPIKTDQGLQGQEDRLHQSALDQPGAGQHAAAEPAATSPSDAELVKTGGFGEGVAALDSGQVDIAPIPSRCGRSTRTSIRAVVVASEVLPPLDNVVGVTTVEMAEKKGDFIRAVIRARRKAVIFMREHPDEAAEIVAKAYNIDRRRRPERRENLTTSKTKGVPYWGEGEIHLDGLKRMIEAQRARSARSPAKSTTARSSTRASCRTTSRRCDSRAGARPSP